MKTTIKTTATFFAVIALLLASNVTFAQKHNNTKRTSNSQYSSPRSSYSSNSNESGWSFGAELMLNKTTYSNMGNGYGNFSPGFFAVADYSLTRETGLIFKLGYDNKQAGMEAGGVSAEASIDYLNISSLFRYDVAPQFFLAAGPVLNFSMGMGKITVFDKTSKQSAPQDPAVTTRFGLTLEAGYSVAITHKIALVPTIGYDFFLTGATEDGNGRLNNLHIAAGLQFKLN